MSKGVYIRSEVVIKKLKEALIGKPSRNKEKLGKRDNKHYAYKGDLVSQNVLHIWLYRRLGKASSYECVYCGSTDNLEWASISHKAKRDLEDYIPLCKKCHNIYDDIGKKVKERRIKNGTFIFPKDKKTGKFIKYKEISYA